MALPPFPTQTEMAASLYGTWRLFLGDKAGLGFFGSGRSGFWRACWVLALVLPIALLSHLVRAAGADETAITLAGLARFGFSFTIVWYGYALVVHYVAPALDRDDRFFDYMIPEYWSSLPASVLLLVAITLNAAGVIPDSLSQVVLTVCFGTVLWLRAQIIRLALDVSYGTAVGLTIASSVLEEVAFATLFYLF